MDFGLLARSRTPRDFAQDKRKPTRKRNANHKYCRGGVTAVTLEVKHSDAFVVYHRAQVIDDSGLDPEVVLSTNLQSTS
jgi:hypothetical protein